MNVYKKLPFEEKFKILDMILSLSPRLVTLHPVSFKLQWCDISASSDGFVIDNRFKNLITKLVDENNKLLTVTDSHKLLAWIKTIGWNFIPFKDIHTFSTGSNYDGSVSNGKDKNKDIYHQGSVYNHNYHTMISSDDINWTKTNTNGITLRDVTEAVFRIKKAKFDHYHEHYENIVVVNKDNNKLSTLVTFNYN